SPPSLPESVHPDGALPRGFCSPVFVENGPQHLVEVLTVAVERLPEDSLLNGANLPERAVPAAVPHRRARLEPVDAHRFERELDYPLSPFLEHTGSPVGRSDRESPLCRLEAGLQLAELEDADRRIRSINRHGEAGVSPDLPLPNRPRDEALEAFNRGGRRRVVLCEADGPERVEEPTALTQCAVPGTLFCGELQ